MATVNKIRYRSQSAGTVSRVKNYIERDDKTFCKELGRKLVTGLNCSPDFADREFIATRESHRKESKTWFHHYTQSFSPKEKVTPEEAHRIAVEFAERAWPEHEVVIATHLDARRNGGLAFRFGAEGRAKAPQHGSIPPLRNAPAALGCVSVLRELEVQIDEYHRRVHEIRRQQG